MTGLDTFEMSMPSQTKKEEKEKREERHRRREKARGRRNYFKDMASKYNAESMVIS